MTRTTTRAKSPTTSPPAGVGSAWSGLMSSAVKAAEGRVDDWTRRLDRVAASAADRGARGGSASARAGVSGVAAGLAGKNPAWAALKGVWAGGGTGVKVAIVAAAAGLVVVLILSPVLLVVGLLTVAVVVVVSKTRAASR